MSTPDNQSDTFEGKVNAVASQMTQGEDGNWQIPDGVEADEAVKYAATLEKRRRDTQAQMTKSQQRAKALEVENEKLAANWESDAVQNLSSAEQARLEELKCTDPEAWRQELMTLEESKKTAFQEKRQGISKEVSQATELELREQQLIDFNNANPEYALTDDVIENDIPPRITKKLTEGKVSFQEFLDDCKAYLAKPKAIKKDPAPDAPRFADAAGSASPSAEAQAAQSSSDYKDEIF